VSTGVWFILDAPPCIGESLNLKTLFDITASSDRERHVAHEPRDAVVPGREILLDVEREVGEGSILDTAGFSSAVAAEVRFPLEQRRSAYIADV